MFARHIETKGAARPRQVGGVTPRPRQTTVKHAQAAPSKIVAFTSPLIRARVANAQRSSAGSISHSAVSPARLPVNAPLRMGRVNDPLEHEADRVAEQVTRAPAAGVSATNAIPQISRKAAAAQQSKNLDGLTGGGAGVHEVLRSPGAPLEGATRILMEQRFGRDFSGVRLHTSSTAEESASDLHANAYTVGSNVVFGAGQFAPGTPQGQRLLAHELAHVAQQTGQGGAGHELLVQRSPKTGAGPAGHGVVKEPANKPAAQMVNGVTYIPVWDAQNKVWDFVNYAGHSLNGSHQYSCQPDTSDARLFWQAVSAVGVRAQAQELAKEAVDRMMKEKGEKLKELQQGIDAYRYGFQGKPEWDDHLKLLDERKAIFDEYDPSVERNSPAPWASGGFVPLDYSTRVDPLYGPHELSPLVLDPLQNAKYAPEMIADNRTPFGTFGGIDTNTTAVRSSINDAYGYNLPTDALQVADDLERLARAGYTEIHVATGTHGGRGGVLTPEPNFIGQDTLSINETMLRHPGLKIIAYNMADPFERGMFTVNQALAAEGLLPGGATHAAFCYSRTRIPDLHAEPLGPYGSVESIDRSGGGAGMSYGHGALSVGFGGLAIYGGLQDPNSTAGAIKIAGGGAQVLGGASYMYGAATDSVGMMKFGSTLGEIGGGVGTVMGLYDVYRMMNAKFEPGASQMTAAESGLEGLRTAQVMAGVIFPELALPAVAAVAVAKPMAEKAADIAAPAFIGGMSQAYGVPESMLWKMH